MTQTCVIFSINKIKGRTNYVRAFIQSNERNPTRHMYKGRIFILVAHVASFFTNQNTKQHKQTKTSMVNKMEDEKESPETRSSNIEDRRNAEGRSDLQDKKPSKSDDNVESSSSSSDNGKGSGSGGSGGYNADCSSSDTSSIGAAKGNIPQKEMRDMSIAGDGEQKMQKKPDKSRSKNAKKSKTTKKAKGKEDVSRAARETTEMDDSQESSTMSAAQWNGFRVHHPMDPRIDLSTVAHIQTSAMSTTLPNNVNVPSQNLSLQKSLDSANPPVMSWPTIQAPPTADQYLNLMKVKKNPIVDVE